MKKILITSALPYANGPLHFGHLAGAYLPADCYARFQRLQKNDVLYICGSDEYGIAITLSAELAGRTPQEQVNLYHEINREFFKKLHISFDHYSRTTWPGHIKPVQQYFLDLLHNGYIEERTTEQLYSETEKRFLADRYVVGECPRCGFENARGDECPKCGASYEATDLKNPRSKMTQSPLIRKTTEHWFLLLDRFKDKLTTWIDSKDWKPNVSHFAKGYIQDLHPRAITRDSTWGVPVPLPGSEGKVLYVWFDAPIGYISATMDWAQKQGDADLWKKYWCDHKTKLVNFIGKDNIPFHAAIFPAMTMGQNQPYKLVDELPANEFYNLEGRQFSKSDGWYIELDDFLQRYAVDQLRYVIAANAPETSDSEFSWKDFQGRCNSDLVGKYGNFINRVLVFAHNQCQGRVPEKKAIEAIDKEFIDNLHDIVRQAADCYEKFRIRRASQMVMELAHLGNVYFDHKKPWQEAKQEATRASMETTIACCIDCIQALALISYPLIPSTAEKVWQFLGWTSSIAQMSWEKGFSSFPPAQQQLKKPEILFSKIEDKQIEEEISKLHNRSKHMQEQQQTIKTTPQIDIDDVRKLELRVGLILQASPVPKSKKLLQLEVDIGTEKRIVVAGIGANYTPEQLIGKKVVVVVNLKPATLMGVTSQGMILAGSNDGLLEVVSVQNLPPGSPVS